ncbi:G-protein coupled receptor 4-like [Betta splendens]|uniref:G-protein coupled receptor 4-like n=1 Tax=Betta splendens TaxID=158456 RepID=A0A6P7PD07_BETSP|nr:G-protein coupled receptor 4-like [Betta splendens]XP_055358511.1 G-protein coupled receptor 4-like [Betta splendens]
MEKSNVTGCSTCSSVDGLFVVTLAIIALCLPLTLLAAYSLFTLVQKDQVVPVYIINVLLSDLIQLCCMVVEVSLQPLNSDLFFFVYYFGVVAGVGFMVCVALERYLVVAWPLWYRFRRTLGVSLAVSAVVWTLPLLYILPVHFQADFVVSETILAVVFLLPYPLLLFFLGGTLRALYTSISVPAAEKRRIVAVLVLVVLIYTLIFLPSAIWSLAEDARSNNTFSDLSFTIIKFSPLADLFLYVFLKQGGLGDKLLAFVCCTMERNGISRSA